MPIFINETEIEDDAIFSEMQYHRADNMELARDAASQALVVRELLKQEAVRQKLDGIGEDADAVDAALMQLVEKEVSVPSASAEFCRTYYEQNKEKFRTSDASSAILPFEMVEEKISNYLQTRSVREGIRAYVLSLARNAHITGFDLAGSL